MCELAAVAGCDPVPYSWCELYWMARAKDVSEWSRTWATIAQLYNVNRGKDATSINLMDFYPWGTGSKDSSKDARSSKDAKDERLIEEFYDRAEKRQRPTT